MELIPKKKQAQIQNTPVTDECRAAISAQFATDAASLVGEHDPHNTFLNGSGCYDTTVACNVGERPHQHNIRVQRFIRPGSLEETTTVTVKS